MSRALRSWRAPRARTTVRVALLGMLAVLVVGGWATHRGTPPSPRGADASARLVQVAQAFDNDYAANRDGAVWDRFDRASQAVIPRADYIRRHRLCPTAPGPATVVGAQPAPHGWWRVTYRIDQVTLVDLWHRQGGHWRFSLWRSNPGAVHLYRLPLAAYLRAEGCTH